jgi:hypothetical protein
VEILLFAKGRVFHAPEARQVPAGDGHILEGDEERVIRNDSAGEDAMRAAVGARGLDTTFKTHTNSIVVHGCFAGEERSL